MACYILTEFPYS